MKNKKIINQNTVFSFFNWGEPLLNPNIFDFFDFMNKNRLFYNISTNCSVSLKNKKINDNNLFGHMKNIIFSVCGFSQESYDKMQGFNFNIIKQNIIENTNIIRTNGGKNTNISMSYHVYQYNYGKELLEARDFCNKYGIIFNPYYAIISNSFEAYEYFHNELSYERLFEASKQLFLFNYEDIIKKRPINYRCPQYDMLTISENGMLLPCCAYTFETLGYILDMNYEDIVNKKKLQKVVRNV